MARIDAYQPTFKICGKMDVSKESIGMALSISDEDIERYIKQLKKRENTKE